MRRLQALALSACLLFGASARAVPLIYDFEGTGTLCSYVAGWCTPVSEVTFTGSVLIDVLADGPNGSDGFVNPIETIAFDLEGWVYSEFYIQWDGGSFSSHPIPEGVMPTYRTTVVNTPDYDLLHNTVEWNDSDSGRYVFAQLVRQTGDSSWLNGLTFEDRGLAPPIGDYFPYNYLTFNNLIMDPSGGQTGESGVVGQFSYFALRPTEVPEPATLSLFGLALAGLGIARRRPRVA